MKTIEIAAPGFLTTVQDLGREGFGPMGVSPSGAADAISLRLGNLLVGNSENAAGLEMTLLGGTFHFSEDGVVSLTGSDFGATLDAAPVPLYAAVQVRPGQTLQLGPTRGGARTYLCVRGGIDVPPFLGSASTHLLSGLGGFAGRALRKRDTLKIGSSLDVNAAHFKTKTIPPDMPVLLAPKKILRVTRGLQSDWFPEAAHRLFYESTYRVAEESDRMGIRLLGDSLSCAPSKQPTKQMITEGVPLGAIQIPPSGQPIIMFVEQQTTGGYPKIANVISADMQSLGQLRPRDEIRFEQVTLEAAQSLLRQQEQLLASIRSILA